MTSALVEAVKAENTGECKRLIMGLLKRVLMYSRQIITARVACGYYRSFDIVKLLVSNWANIHDENEFGWSCVHFWPCFGMFSWLFGYL